MAFFKRKEKVPTEVERLDWKLLERGAVALYHKGAVLSQDLAWLRQQRYVIHELDAATWNEPGHFHDAVSRALSFPAYYGKNLASWIDCVAELPVPDESGPALRCVRENAAAARADHSRQPRDDITPLSAHRPPAAGVGTVGRSAYSVRAGRRDAGNVEPT